MVRICSFLGLLCLLLLASCTANKRVTKDTDIWLPKTFNAKEGVLLIQKDDIRKRQLRLLTTHLAKKYPYKYEFATRYEIEDKDGKYADAEKYRYAWILDTDLFTYTSVSSSSTGGMSTSTRTRAVEYLYFLDRQRNSIYRALTKGKKLKKKYRIGINTIVRDAKNPGIAKKASPILKPDTKKNRRKARKLLSEKQRERLGGFGYRSSKFEKTKKDIRKENRDSGKNKNSSNARGSDRNSNSSNARSSDRNSSNARSSDRNKKSSKARNSTKSRKSSKGRNSSKSRNSKKNRNSRNNRR